MNECHAVPVAGPKHATEPDIPVCAECPAAAFAFYGEAVERHRFDPAGLRHGVVRFPPRALVFPVRQSRHRLCTLREGWAFDYRVGAGGRRQILDFRLPGDLILPDLFGSQPVRHRIQALTPVVLCTFDLDAVEGTLGRHRGLQRALVRHLADAYDSLREQVATVGAGFASASVARLLLDLRARLERRGMVREDGFDFPLSQIHIADTLGLTKVHVSRVLSAFRQEGFIDYRPGHLDICDPAGLEAAAGLAPD